MHPLLFAPVLLAGLSALSSTFALPTHDQDEPPTARSEPFTPTSDVSKAAGAGGNVALAAALKLTPDNTCGKVGNGNGESYTCDPNRHGGGPCCSQYGYCGSGSNYCGEGCQHLFGKCDKPVGPKPSASRLSSSSSTSSSRHESAKTTASSAPVSSSSRHKPAKSTASSAPVEPKPKEYNCGPSFRYEKCPDNMCCSDSGYCGNTTEHCMVPQNCQKAFGRCDSDIVPGGVSTVADPRPLVGDISYDETVERCRKERTIALTFDDGPGEYTSDLLDLLARYDAKATFFITGNNNGKGEIDTTRKWFDLIKRMIAEGHQVGSHTFDHARLSTMPGKLRKLEILKNERAIANIIGKYPTYLRAPYSACAPGSACRTDVKALGYHLVHYDLSTEDYLHPGPGQIEASKEIVRKALDKAPANGNLLVIQHDIISQSAGSLTELTLQLVREKGWKAVTVGECINDPIHNWYREPSWISPGKTPTGACVVSRGRFCGTIPPFSDKASCFKSAGECMAQVKVCPNTDDSNAEGCVKFANICRLELVFCGGCGGKGQRPCESKHFEYKLE